MLRDPPVIGVDRLAVFLQPAPLLLGLDDHTQAQLHGL
jgi:hypothetical protein